VPEATVFTIDEKGVNELFNDRQGDIRQYMDRQAKQVVQLAKRKVGKKTRALERSIDYQMIPGTNGVSYEVTASNHIAFMHHEGTRPHIITPHTRRAMRFRDGGRVVYARIVAHPGTRGNPFLRDALREVVR